MPHLIFEIFSTILGTVSALLPITNPLTTIALLPVLTAHLTPAERAKQMRHACYYMAAILAAFLLAGALLMDFFSISIPGLRIAGGLIVCKFGFTMLFPLAESEQDKKIHATGDIAFSPLAMPILSGPGSIAVVISMSTGVHTQTQLPIWLGYVAVIIGILLVACITWLVMHASERLASLLGPNGIGVASRMMGFLLICIGVQFMINGASNLLHDPQFWPELLAS
jgi:multiple antibiotic resistance protein